MRFYLLTACFLGAILTVGIAKAAWTVVYNPYTKQTSVVYVPDNYCPHNHYNPYNPYQPYQPYQPAYRPYQPAPVYQFNFGHDKHKNHGKHHNKHNNKPCK